MVQVPTQGAGEHKTLEIPSTGNKVLHLVAMRDAGYILLDDRTIVQFLRDVVTCGSDQLHPSAKGCMIRFGSDKRGKERVVHVDNPEGVLLDKVRGQDLHISSQNDQLDVCIFKKSELLCLSPCSVLR